MDQFYYESGYIVDGYYTYTADAESIQSGNFTSSCDANVILGGVIVEGTSSWIGNASLDALVSKVASAVANMDANFTQSAMISHIEGADLFAMSNAALAAEVSRLRDNNIEASVTFTIATDASRTRNYSSEDAAAFSIVADNLRVRYEEAALDAAFSMSAAVDVIPGGTLVEATATLDAAFTSSIQIEWIRDVAASLTSSFSQDTAAVRNQFFTSDITANTEVAIAADLFKDMSADLASSASLTTPGERIIQGASTENAAFAPSLTVTIFKNSFAVLDSTATVSAVVDTTKSFVSTIASQATLFAQVNRIQTGSAAVNSNFSISVYNTFKEQRPHAIFRRYGSAAGSTTPITSSDLNGTYYYKGNSSLYLSGYNSTTNTGNHAEIIGTNWEFASGQDFVITFRPKIQKLSVSSKILGAVNSSGQGWAFSTAATTARPVFQYWNGSSMSTMAHGSNSYSDFAEWKVTRVGSTITFSVSGLGSVTSTYSGAINPGGITKLTIGGIAAGTAATSYFDELYIARGVGSVQTYFADGRIADGKLDSTVILYHFDNNNVNEDLSGYTLAQAALLTTASVSAGPIKTAQGKSTVAGQFTQTTATTKIIQGSAAIQSAGFVSVVTGRIRPFVDIEVSTFSATVIANKTVSETSALDSTVDLTATADRLMGPITAALESQSSISASADITRTVEASINSEGFLVAATGRIRPFADIEVSTFNLTADSQVVKVAEAAIATNANLTAVATRLMSPIVVDIAASTSLSALGAALPSGTVNMTATASVTIAANRIRGVDSAQSVTAALAAQARNIHGGVIAADSTATVSALVYKIKQFNADLTALAFELAIISKIGNVIVDMPATTQLTAISKVTTGSVVDAVAESSLTATGVANKPVAAALLISTEMTTDGDAGIIGEVNVTATTGMSTTAVTVQTVQANIQSESTLIATAGRIRPGISLEWGEASLTATVGVIKQAVTNVQSQASMTTGATRKVSGVASLQCQGFSLIVARVLNLEASITYRVPAERTVWRVRPEQYIWTVESENRSYKIKG